MDARIHIAFIWLILMIVVHNSFEQRFTKDFWKSSKPGELLNALDLMTIEDVKARTYTELVTESSIPPTTISPPPTRRNAVVKRTPITPRPSPKKRMIISEDNSAASTSDEAADDYERTYEQFVKTYFDDAADHYLSNDHEDGSSNESDEASNLSSDISDETDATELDAVPYATSSKSAKKSQKAGKKCRKVRRKNEICVICKNQRNGERFETCSYERDSQPESYAYESEKKYRKTRDRDNNSSDGDGEDEDDESSKEIFSESKIQEKNTPKPQKPASKNTTTPISSCIKRTIDGKSCYYCKDAVGTEALKCFNLNLTSKKQNNRNPINVNSDTHQKRRIYKRTLSYVYEKGLDSNGTMNSSEEFNNNMTIPLK